VAAPYMAVRVRSKQCSARHSSNMLFSSRADTRACSRAWPRRGWVHLRLKRFLLKPPSSAATTETSPKQSGLVFVWAGAGCSAEPLSKRLPEPRDQSDPIQLRLD
jgi:hypothetical protein